MSADLFSYSTVSCFKERPSQNIRYLISRQLPKLVDIAISEALQFVNTNQTKGKALKQLKYTVLIAEESITPFIQKIIKALIRVWQLEIEDGQKIIKQMMAVIGKNVKSSFYLPLMMDILKEDEVKNSPKNTIILLKLIAYMLQTSEGLQAHLPEIISLLARYEQQFVENDEGLITVTEISLTLVNRLKSLEDEKLVSTLFSVFLNAQSTESIPKEFKAKVAQSMIVLANKAGFKSVPELHSHEVGPLLAKIIDSKEYIQWTKTSKNRFKFDTIARNCQGEAIRFLSDILTIIEYCISQECDIAIRMDTLVLVQKMMEDQAVRQALKQHALRVYTNILNRAIKWKVGKPFIKIRQAGVIGMINMIENGIISDEQLIECFKDILPEIKSCMSDDWAPQLRLACCTFFEKYLYATKDKIKRDQLSQLYPSLLERLDDSQDGIRKKITTAINIFFLCKSLTEGVSSSIIEYMIERIIVHYDDKNEEIRQAIHVSLKYAASVDPQRVLKLAKEKIGTMKNKDLCKELIEDLEENSK